MPLELAGMIDLHDEEYQRSGVTLHYFSSNSQRLRDFARKNHIQPGQRVIVVGRSMRIRELLYEVDGVLKVVLCEYDAKKLSVEAAVFAHYEKRANGIGREALAKLREGVEARIERAEEREKRRRERAKKKRPKAKKGTKKKGTKWPAW